MTSTLIMDKAGRITLPSRVREELQLVPGDILKVESTRGKITLRPLRGTGSLRKKNGLWTFRAEKPLTHASVERVRKNVRAQPDARSVTT
jgi:AbrB family looped-hinge helix DNA binding protein